MENDGAAIPIDCMAKTSGEDARVHHWGAPLAVRVRSFGHAGILARKILRDDRRAALNAPGLVGMWWRRQFL